MEKQEEMSCWMMLVSVDLTPLLHEERKKPKIFIFLL